MNSDFEKRIRNGADFFNSSQPDAGHLDRFAAKLEAVEKKHRKVRLRATLSKIAATLLLLLSVAFVAYQIIKTKTASINSSEITTIQLPEELNEVLSYYDANSLVLLDSIMLYASDSAEGKRISKMVQNQFAVLDANSAAIEKEYQKNPENQALSAALINNKRKKTEVAEQVIRQMDLSNRSLF